MHLGDILLSPKKAERHPLEALLIGFVYTSLSLFLSLWIFPDYASLVMVFFTVVSCVYLVQGAFLLEETAEEEVNSEEHLFKQHFQLLKLLMFLFLGFLLAFTFWKIVLPVETSSTVFAVQETIVTQIRSITGKAVQPAQDMFWPILLNNLRVLFLSVIFALVYGAGAIFILVWNASTMGFAIGQAVESVIGVKYVPSVFVRYFLHGLPEMLAYFSAALAGGIMYIAIIRADTKNRKVKRIVIDATLLIVASVILLVVAALLETYVSPLF